MIGLGHNFQGKAIFLFPLLQAIRQLTMRPVACTINMLQLLIAIVATVASTTNMITILIDDYQGILRGEASLYC